MKNIITLKAGEEVLNYTNSLWRSDVVKREFSKNKYICEVLQKFAKYPRFFYTMTDKEIESSHFTTWMNTFALRPHYNTPGISDMFYVHEIFHASEMEHIPDMDFNDWYRKMVTNEFESSLFSEVEVYLQIKELRAETFEFQIWCDKWIKRHKQIKQFDFLGTAVRQTMDEVRKERKRIMISPDPFDFLELQIHNYLEQNVSWAQIWSTNYNEVETHLFNFKKQCDEGNSQVAIANHLNWLEKHKENDVPFYNEAVKFSEIYHANKNKFGNKILGKDN